jgi:hypothetical protein
MEGKMSYDTMKDLTLFDLPANPSARRIVAASLAGTIYNIMFQTGKKQADATLHLSEVYHDILYNFERRPKQNKEEVIQKCQKNYRRKV